MNKPENLIIKKSPYPKKKYNYKNTTSDMSLLSVSEWKIPELDKEVIKKNKKIFIL